MTVIPWGAFALILGLALITQSVARQLVGAAGLARGDEAVHDLAAATGEHRHGAGHAEVDVVGVGHDHEHAARVIDEVRHYSPTDWAPMPPGTYPSMVTLRWVNTQRPSRISYSST